MSSGTKKTGGAARCFLESICASPPVRATSTAFYKSKKHANQ